MKQLTPRGKALRWMTEHRGILEDPTGSNRDRRADGITAAQRRIGTMVGGPWCGTWCANAALAGGVTMTSAWRWASVAFIEYDARLGKNGFIRWTHRPDRVRRGDLAVLFGHGQHVEMVRRIFPRLGYLITDGGNTSPGNTGSQDNGGGSYRRVRKLKDVYGFAVVNYPGGPR
jgi:hypothetical protein